MSTFPSIIEQVFAVKVYVVVVVVVVMTFFSLTS